MLDGKLVRLRALEPTDLERVYAWINDREVTRYLTARYPISRSDELRWLERGSTNNSTVGVRLAIDTRDGVHIGTINVHRVAPEDRNAGLGILIGEKQYWSNGYGADAIVTLLHFAFDEMNLNRVWLHTFEFNDRGYACYRKCGFQEEGRLREHYYGEGGYWDSIVMGVLKDEFEALHNTSTEATEVARAGAR